METKTFRGAVDYFWFKTLRLDTTHSINPHGTHHAMILLEEIDQVLGIATREQRPELTRIQQSARAWFLFFDWKQENQEPMPTMHYFYG